MSTYTAERIQRARKLVLHAGDSYDLAAKLPELDHERGHHLAMAMVQMYSAGVIIRDVVEQLAILVEP